MEKSLNSFKNLVQVMPMVTKNLDEDMTHHVHSFVIIKKLQVSLLKKYKNVWRMEHYHMLEHQILKRTNNQSKQ